jgi:hypothetical protein
MRIVRPFRSLSVVRACVRVDSGLDKEKLCSDRRVDADRPRLRAVLGGGKTFLHGLGQTQTSAHPSARSALPLSTDIASATRLLIPVWHASRAARSGRASRSRNSRVRAWPRLPAKRDTGPAVRRAIAIENGQVHQASLKRERRSRRADSGRRYVQSGRLR